MSDYSKGIILVTHTGKQCRDTEEKLFKLGYSYCSGRTTPERESERAICIETLDGTDKTISHTSANDLTAYKAGGQYAGQYQIQEWGSYDWSKIPRLGPSVSSEDEETGFIDLACDDQYTLYFDTTTELYTAGCMTNLTAGEALEHWSEEHACQRVSSRVERAAIFFKAVQKHSGEDYEPRKIRNLRAEIARYEEQARETEVELENAIEAEIQRKLEERRKLRQETIDSIVKAITNLNGDWKPDWHRPKKRYELAYDHKAKGLVAFAGNSINCLSVFPPIRTQTIAKNIISTLTQEDIDLIWNV